MVEFVETSITCHRFGGFFLKRCVIVSAGEIHDYKETKFFLQPDDFFFFCDDGNYHDD